jgi:hypothetical protein
MRGADEQCSSPYIKEMVSKVVWKQRLNNVWSSPQLNAIPCSYPYGWIFIRSLLWVHGKAAVHVHYNCSCQCGSRELYKWSFCTYKDINKYHNVHNFTSMPIILSKEDPYIEIFNFESILNQFWINFESNITDKHNPLDSEKTWMQQKSIESSMCKPNSIYILCLQITKHTINKSLHK